MSPSSIVFEALNYSYKVESYLHMSIHLQSESTQHCRHKYSRELCCDIHHSRHHTGMDLLGIHQRLNERTITTLTIIIQTFTYWKCWEQNVHVSINDHELKRKSFMFLIIYVNVTNAASTFAPMHDNLNMNFSLRLDIVKLNMGVFVAI